MSEKVETAVKSIFAAILFSMVFDLHVFAQGLPPSSSQEGGDPPQSDETSDTSELQEGAAGPQTDAQDNADTNQNINVQPAEQQSEDQQAANAIVALCSQSPAGCAGFVEQHKTAVAAQNLTAAETDAKLATLAIGLAELGRNIDNQPPRVLVQSVNEQIAEKCANGSADCAEIISGRRADLEALGLSATEIDAQLGGLVLALNNIGQQVNDRIRTNAEIAAACAGNSGKCQEFVAAKIDALKSSGLSPAEIDAQVAVLVIVVSSAAGADGVAKPELAIVLEAAIAIVTDPAIVSEVAIISQKINVGEPVERAQLTAIVEIIDVELIAQASPEIADQIQKIELALTKPADDQIEVAVLLEAVKSAEVIFAQPQQIAVANVEDIISAITAVEAQVINQDLVAEIKQVSTSLAQGENAVAGNAVEAQAPVSKLIEAAAVAENNEAVKKFETEQAVQSAGAAGPTEVSDDNPLSNILDAISSVTDGIQNSETSQLVSSVQETLERGDSFQTSATGESTSGT